MRFGFLLSSVPTAVLSQHSLSLCTGAKTTAIDSLDFSSKQVAIEFVGLNPFYKQGFPYTGKVTPPPLLSSCSGPYNPLEAAFHPSLTPVERKEIISILNGAWNKWKAGAVDVEEMLLF